jgi:septal ring-binding cell division protein DamX
MAENRRERDGRYYFTRGQLALLGAAFTAASLVVFVLGIFVGKEIEARRIVRPEEPLVKVPIKPPPDKGGGNGGTAKKDDLTFYNTLTDTAPAKPVESAEKVAAKKAPATAREEAKPEAESAEAKNRGKTWSVQVNSYPDAKSAGELLEQLKNKGYSAFVTEAQVNGKTWYRVRVGRFTSREEASKTEAALKTKEGYAKAFATRK